RGAAQGIVVGAHGITIGTGVMDKYEITDLHGRQETGLQQLSRIARKDISRFTQRTGQDGGPWLGIAGRVPDTEMVESAVRHRRYQVTKASIDHDKGLAWPLGIGLRPFHIRHPGDHISGGSDKVASRLNFYPDGAPGLLAEARLRFAQQVPKG